MRLPERSLPCVRGSDFKLNHYPIFGLPSVNRYGTRAASSSRSGMTMYLTSQPKIVEESMQSARFT